MNKIKLGVVGIHRGRTMIDYCAKDKRVKLTAVCDFDKAGLDRLKADIRDNEVKFFTDFDEFLEKSDTDAVVLANYANEHAPFAIKCLKHGKHVLSEVLPVQNFAEAVALAEAVENSDKLYAYAENYCYMSAPREMRRLYREGKLGKFEYGEGEYLHNCEPIWPEITYGDPKHWRNNISTFFYCTHSIGPLLHITGLRPVKVTGFEMPYNDRTARMGAKSGWGGLIIITLENGAVLKSIHGLAPSKNSVWYSIYGSLGTCESGRETPENTGYIDKIYTNLDYFEGENVDHRISYTPQDKLSQRANCSGHGGSDFYTMWNFIGKLRDEPDAETIDIYVALDMFLPGLLAYRSVLGGNIPMDVPDFRNKAVREKYRHDTACTDAKVAGDMLQPSYSKGNPIVPDAVYDIIRRKYEQQQNK